MKRPFWLVENGEVVGGSALIMSATAVTSALGFVFWILAARFFTATVVGLVSAAISAMQLLAAIGVLGMGTILVQELPGNPNGRLRLITTAICIGGLASCVAGALFALVAPLVTHEFDFLAQSPASVSVFAAGVAATAITIVLDKACIGSFRPGLQLWRNGAFSASKLALIAAVGLLLPSSGAMALYIVWGVGNLLSLAVFWDRTRLTGAWRHLRSPDWAILARLQSSAISYHLLDLALYAPDWLLPVLVTAVVSPEANAVFYVVWMILSVAFLLTRALTTILHAVGARDPELLAVKTRFTLKLSLLAGLAGYAVIYVLAPYILALFGGHYAADAGISLRIIMLGVFPDAILAHYVAVNQAQRRLRQPGMAMATLGIARVTLAYVGATHWGLEGVVGGWLIATTVAALLAAPALYRVVAPRPLAEAPSPG